MAPPRKKNPFLDNEDDGVTNVAPPPDAPKDYDEVGAAVSTIDSLPPTTDVFASAGDPAYQMASQLSRFNYHPVLIFGGPAAGKTSLITSLLASLKLSADWQLSVNLNDPVISTDTEFGSVQKAESVKLFYQTVQNFIGGVAASSTKKRTPIFLPITLRSAFLNQSVNIALMESSGELYTANPESAEYFARLRADTESLIRDFEGGISFIYILPYTQLHVRAVGVDRAADPAMLRDAEAAVVAMIQAYQQIRVNKARDSHLLLVTKWDAHYDEKKKEEEMEMADILLDTYEDVEVFLKQTYPQALAALNGLHVADNQRLATNYCAGLITGRTITPNTKDIETRDAIRSHQKKIWRWIWKNTQGNETSNADPFPREKTRGGLFGIIDRLLNAVF